VKRLFKLPRNKEAKNAVNSAYWKSTKKLAKKYLKNKANEYLTFLKDLK
jgi:hypothetical protein